MKTFIKTGTFVVIAATAMLTGFESCKSKKVAVEKQTGAVEITLPFSDKKYKSDEDNFRSKQLGKSPDLAAAKKIAMQNAKSEMAGNIQTTLKKVTDQYTNQRTIGNKQDFENKFEELSREVTNQQLVDVQLMDEKIFKEPDGGYTYWVVIQCSKKAIQDGVDQKISKDAKLQVDYDKKKFQEVFDSEMKKLANEQ